MSDISRSFHRIACSGMFLSFLILLTISVATPAAAEKGLKVDVEMDQEDRAPAEDWRDVESAGFNVSFYSDEVEENTRVEGLVFQFSEMDTTECSGTDYEEFSINGSSVWSHTEHMEYEHENGSARVDMSFGGSAAPEIIVSDELLVNISLQDCITIWEEGWSKMNISVQTNKTDYFGEKDVYLCDCESEEEAEEQMGPPGGPTPTPTATETATSTPDVTSNPTATPTATSTRDVTPSPSVEETESKDSPTSHTDEGKGANEQTTTQGGANSTTNDGAGLGELIALTGILIVYIHARAGLE